MAMIGRFETPIQDFDFKPFVVGGRIVRNQVVIQGDIVWVSSEGIRIVVKNGYVCNLASFIISGIFFFKLGRQQRASALHDNMYDTKPGSREWCDKQYLEAMEYDQVSPFKRWLIHLGVSVGGERNWRDAIAPVYVETEPELFI